MKLQRKYQPLCFMYYDVFIKRSSGLILVIIFGLSTRALFKIVLVANLLTVLLTLSRQASCGSFS